MRLLYAYRYGIIGGVSTQLILRRNAFQEVGIDCDLFFSQDNGLSQVLHNDDSVHYGKNIHLKKLIYERKFDLAVIVDSPELIDVARGPAYRRNPVLLDVHTTTRTGLSYLNDLNFRKLAGIIVPSSYSSRFVRSCLPDNKELTVVPNIIDSNVFNLSAQQRKAEVTNTGIREFVWVGKLDHHKNWRLALVYAAMLNEQLGNVCLNVVGGYTAPENQAEAFFELAFRLGISDRVNWLDRVNSTDLAALFQRCGASGGAMLITSRDESFGMAAAEALLCGCPLIANDLPVFHEIFPTSPLITYVDIWQPDQVVTAAKAIEEKYTKKAASDLSVELADRYNNRAFLSAFNSLIQNI